MDAFQNYNSVEDLLLQDPDVQVVALCTPPRVRYALAEACIRGGRHVLLEKPPGVNLAQVEALRASAQAAGVVLFAAWHSRFAPGVERARARLETRRIRRVAIEWREDVRRWHPGQEWVWEPGGLGVFDAGINALSIATHILPRPFSLVTAELITPQNRQTPIAAELSFIDAGGAPVEMSLDWRQIGPQTWTITVETNEGRLVLSDGGAKLQDAGEAVSLEDALGPHAEYAGVYRRFADLLDKSESDVDVTPLRHVADAFLLGRRTLTDAFAF